METNPQKRLVETKTLIQSEAWHGSNPGIGKTVDYLQIEKEFDDG